MILTQKESQEKIIEGVDTACNVVKATLGPNGHNIMIEKMYGDGHQTYTKPKFTKDGVSVADQISARDVVVDMVITAVKEAAKQTHTDAGDGTTSSMVLTQAIVNNAFKGLEGRNVHQVKKGIETAVKDVVAHLKSKAVHIKVGDPLLKKVALVASNGDEEIATLLNDAFDKIGEDGSVWIEESKNDKSSVEIVDGCFYNQGFINPMFVNNPKKDNCELENVRIVLWGGKVKYFTDIKWIYEYFFYKAPNGQFIRRAECENESLLIICEEMEGEALNTCISLNQVLKNCVVSTYGALSLKHDVMEDLAAITGGNYISEERNMHLKKATKEDFGFAKKVVVNRLGTTIVEGDSDLAKVKYRRELIDQLTKETLDDFAMRELKLRDKRLSGGLATIFVGGKTKHEIEERADRFDDALRAVQSALEEGVVAGGGSALLSAMLKVKSINLTTDIDLGYSVLNASLGTVLYQLFQNNYLSEGQESVILNSLASDDKKCYNAATGEIVDAFETGIVDPVKVLRCALQNAASVSAQLILTKHISTRV